MENILKYKIIIFILFFFLPVSVLAYDNKIAHPTITQETVKAYKEFYDDHLQVGDDILLKKGSTEEDVPVTRTINHFYDPIRNIGINDSRTAIEWAFNDEIVGNDYSWPKIIQYYAIGDKEKALVGLGHILHLIQDMSVPPHTRNDPHMGDGFSGAYTGSSIYEEWAKENIKKDFNVNIKRDDLLDFNKPLEVFNFLARYSNGNFFSRDTVFSNVYSMPIVSNYDKRYGYVFDSIIKKKEKLIISYSLDGGGKITTLLERNDDSVIQSYFDRLSKQAVLAGANIIDLFFKEAIPARKDYFKMQKLLQEQELEKAGNLANELAKKGTLGLVIFGITDWFDHTTKKITKVTENFMDGINDYAKRLSQDGKNLAKIGKFSVENLASPTKGPESSNDPGQQKQEGEIIVFKSDTEENNSDNNNTKSDSNTDHTPINLPEKKDQEEIVTINQLPKVEENINKQKESLLNEEDKKEPMPVVPFGAPTVPIIIISGFGGGGGGGSSLVPPNSKNDSNDEVNKEETKEVIADLEKPMVISPENNLQTNKLKVVFSGTAQKLKTLFVLLNGATTTSGAVSETGEWQMELDLNPNKNTLNFLIGDDLGHFSPSVERTVFVDITKPDIDLTIPECQSNAFSFQNNNCLISPQTINPVWSSDSEDLKYFILNINGTISTTTATSTNITLNNDRNQIFKVAGVDHLNNQSDWKEVLFMVDENPVVMNEIAWAGTKGSSYDEWIELYNNTENTINLDNWVLRADDGTPYIELAGEIEGKSYYLIERQNSGEVDELTESPVTDVPADLWVSFGSGLENKGEELFLEFVNKNGTTTVDHISYCDNWCGKIIRGYSMEKISPEMAGDNYDNWAASDTIVFNGLDVKNNEIKATPKKRNGKNYILNFGNRVLESDTVITKDNSPYIVGYGGYEIPAGVNVDIEAGVVLKFLKYVDLKVSGKLNINGRENEEVIFTSFNNQKISPVESNYDFQDPIVYNWDGIHIMEGGEINADNLVVSYVGKTSHHNTPCVFAEKAKVNLQNSKINHCEYIGLKIKDSEVSLINNEIINPGPRRTRGVDVSGSTGEIKNNLVDGYHTGFWIEFGNNIKVDSNIGNNNEEYPFWAHFMSNTEFLNNDGEGNYTNAIRLSGNVGLPQATTTLHKNNIPYLSKIGGPTIVSDSTVIMDSGSVFKTYKAPINIEGKLLINGTKAEPILLTSAKDDSDGVDTGQGILDIVNPIQNTQKVLLKKGGKLEVENAKIRYMNYGISYESASSTVSLKNVWFDNNHYGLKLLIGINIEKFSGIRFTGENQIPATIDLTALGLDFSTK